MKFKCSECGKIFFKRNVKPNETVQCPFCNCYFVWKAPTCHLSFGDD